MTTESIAQGSRSVRLTKYRAAGLRELVSLSLPLIFVLFSGCFMGFCDRLFLAHHSIFALEGCVSAAYLSALFQVPCMRITTMAQVFVGFYNGGGEKGRIGQCIWQMIWFSLFSMALTFPLGWVSAPYFFQGTSIEGPATSYFNCLMWVNFLFPLGAALASFYIGQGKTKILFFATLGSHLVNIGLDYLLIFGVENIIPPLGIFGAALATAIAQGLFCAALFLIFLNARNRELYGTDQYLLRLSAFWSYVKVGLPRAIARIIILFAWVSTARIMSVKNGDFLIILSIGGSLFLLFTFINEGMMQAIITIASSLLGAKDYPLIKRLIRSAFCFLSIVMGLLAIPFFVFPDFLLSFFFTEPLSATTIAVLHKSCWWLWLTLYASGMNVIGFSLISAARDTTFYMIAISFVWLTLYLPAHLAMDLWGCSPDKFWLIVAIDGLIFAAIYQLRIKGTIRPSWLPAAPCIPKQL